MNNVKNNTIYNCNIKSIRIRLGLTQQELADMCGYTKMHISYLERNRKYPNLKCLFLLSKALKSCPLKLYDFNEGFYCDCESCDRVLEIKKE